MSGDMQRLDAQTQRRTHSARAASSLCIAALLLACRQSARQPVRPSAYDPAHDIGTLFADVQLSGIFPDSKEFVDARPKAEPSVIAARYDSARHAPGFVLRAFVEQNFDLPKPAGDGYHTVASQGMLAHLNALWPVLTRSPDSTDPRSSLIPLPKPYVVPGGRFREVYYWDSYFTMLGLVQSGHTDLVKNMLDNFAELINTLGHIPNGNRTYYRTRSQPPYFAAMVGLYARATDTTRALAYLDALEQEHAFWMEGAGDLKPGQAHRRVVRLASGVVLNRYWDDSDEPRPESYRPDVEIGQTVPESLRANFYRNVRATAESGWDFSSRWLRDPKDLRTLETIELIPVAFRRRAGDAQVAERFKRQASARREAVLGMYDPKEGFFFDRRWRTGELVTDRPSLAAAEPLYFSIATAEQGTRVAERLEREFLKPGGFVTTTFASGQQWDGPNGWPPLEWLTLVGVGHYGRGDLANKAASRWLALIQRTYKTTGRMMEKYDVVNLSKKAGGGEYPTQDGFGWTNGVALGLAAQERARMTPVPARP